MQSEPSFLHAVILDMGRDECAQHNRICNLQWLYDDNNGYLCKKIAWHFTTEHQCSCGYIVSAIEQKSSAFNNL